MLDRRGFLFTVTIFLILMYILLSISVWVKSIESSERSFAEFYKESTVELTIEQITPEKVNETARVIMARSLTRLNDHTRDFPVEGGPSADEHENIRGALLELLVNGSADEGYFQGGQNISAEGNSSLSAWAGNLNASLRSIGIYVNEFEVANFTVGQSDIDKVNYSFDMKLGLKDYSNVTSVSRTYRIRNSLDITGYVDPALARESREGAGDNLTIYRQFFFNKDEYGNYSDIRISKMGQSVQGGQGFLYGPLALASGTGDKVQEYSSIAPYDRRNYILVGTFEEIEYLTPGIYESFAGYILTSNSTIADDGCPGGSESDTLNPIKHTAAPECKPSFSGSGIITVKPFIVAKNFDVNDAPECPLLGGGTMNSSRCVLMLSSYLPDQVKNDPPKKLSTNGAGLFALEDFRDFVMCGYYTHNPNAPSYLQRLLNGSYGRNSTDYGIETFVIGNYANDSGTYDLHGRLDRDLFVDSIGEKIRGLPGCRDFNACSDSPITGIFAVSPETKSDYGLEPIACKNGAAGCD